MLVVEGLTCRFGTKAAVDNASFSVVPGGFVGVITLSYLLELVITPPHWGDVAAGVFLPHLAGAGSVILAVGIVGATVMPHAIYLHSGLT